MTRLTVLNLRTLADMNGTGAWDRRVLRTAADVIEDLLSVLYTVETTAQGTYAADIARKARERVQ